MEIKIILNGGIKSCCSVIPTEQVKQVISNWLKDSNHELKIIDITTDDEFIHDEVSLLASQFFADRIYPLVYIDSSLVSLGHIPEKEILLELMNNPKFNQITLDDIIEAQKHQKN